MIITGFHAFTNMNYSHRGEINSDFREIFKLIYAQIYLEFINKLFMKYHFHCLSFMSTPFGITISNELQLYSFQPMFLRVTALESNNKNNRCFYVTLIRSLLNSRYFV